MGLEGLQGPRGAKGSSGLTIPGILLVQVKKQCFTLSCKLQYRLPIIIVSHSLINKCHIDPFEHNLENTRTSIASGIKHFRSAHQYLYKKYTKNPLLSIPGRLGIVLTVTFLLRECHFQVHLSMHRLKMK